MSGPFLIEPFWDPDGRACFVARWFCPPPPPGERYRVVEQVWIEDTRCWTRDIFRIEPIEFWYCNGYRLSVIPTDLKEVS